MLGSKQSAQGSASASDAALFGRYFQEMLNEGVYLAPSQFETLFVSLAIQKEHIEKIVEANYNALKKAHNL